MDFLQAAMDVSLCRAVSVTAQASSRVPLPIRAGRIGSSLAARAYRIDLRDHLVFPGLINAHEHLHVNAVPPLPSRAPFPNSYAWIAAFREHFAEPAVIAALQVPKALRLRHGALKNLLAGSTCVVHHDPWHPVLDESNFPVTLLRNYGWSYALGWPDYGPPVQPSFAATPADRPWLIHLAEGTDAIAQAELAQLDRLGCLAANSVLVHGVGLREQDVDRVIASDAAVGGGAANVEQVADARDLRDRYASVFAARHNRLRAAAAVLFGYREAAALVPSIVDGSARKKTEPTPPAAPT